MQITCQECQGKFRIADEKIPENKSVNITCPKCKKKIRVQGRVSEEKLETNAKTNGVLPFDVLGDEQTAMLCCDQESPGKTIQKNLADMGYKTVFVNNSKDAIKMTRFHPFDVAVIDASFDPDTEGSKHIFNHLTALPMVSRRNLFIAYISDNYRTNDHMGAYCQSVNLIVNRKQVSEFTTVFHQAIKENDVFYSVYKETMRKYA
jgi:predicted Zn finger-like uncharacterized protein